MIIETEFRLGNLIYYGSELGVIAELKTHGNNKIGIRTFDFDNYVSFGKEIKPIKLTPELLEKCGFEKRVTIGHSVEYFIGENPITHDWMLKLLWQNSRDYPFYRNGYHVIKYVHQLQNLYYALLGEELIINFKS